MSQEESEHLLRDLSYNERYSLLQLEIKKAEAEARKAEAEAEARKAEAEARKAVAEARKAKAEVRKMEAEFSGIDADTKALILLARAQSRQVYRWAYVYKNVSVFNADLFFEEASES